VDAPLLAGLVDDAEDAGEATDRRRQDEDDAEREEEAPQDFRVVTQRLPHATRPMYFAVPYEGASDRYVQGPYFVPYNRSPASPKPGTM
jgi:hypothetical protein